MDVRGRRKDGHAATTDANLVLGRILPEFFPNIFGKTEDQPLDTAAAEQALDALAEQVNSDAEAAGHKRMTCDEVRLLVSHAPRTLCEPGSACHRLSSGAKCKCCGRLHFIEHAASVQVAMGFIKIANATMCRPIQALTQMRGYDVAQHVLACFGGGGGPARLRHRALTGHAHHLRAPLLWDPLRCRHRAGRRGHGGAGPPLQAAPLRQPVFP